MISELEQKILDEAAKLVQDTKPIPLRCKWGFHRWGKWSSPQEKYWWEKLWSASQYEWLDARFKETFQYHFCIDCHEYETRQVSYVRMRDEKEYRKK